MNKTKNPPFINLTPLHTLLFGTVLIATSSLVTACSDSNSTSQTDSNISQAKHQSTDNMPIDTSEVTDSNTHDEKNHTEAINHATPEIIEIDWSVLNGDRKAQDTEQFQYPFAIDSNPVQNYAKMYGVDNQTARHNLTIGMVSNEPLSKILNQIGQEYRSHRLTTDKQMQLIITTTDNVKPSKQDYIIEDKFAKGLVLPITINNVKNNSDETNNVSNE